MKITCPVCSSSYMVPDSALGAKGRKVKCASCGHIWHQDPPANPSDAPITDIKDSPKSKAKAGKPVSSNVPAVTTPAFTKGRVAMLALILACGYFANNFSDYAEGLGYYDIDGLALQEMDVNIKREENKLVAYITGSIINETDDQDIKLPEKVYFKLLSGQKRVMAETDYDLPEDTILAPGETVALTPKIGNISGNARELVLDLGNSLERSFRK